MLLSKITELLNTELAGEMLSYREAVPFLDHAIDDINVTLNACFPAFSELDDAVSDYKYFPERYIRMVVIPGAAWYYYTMDEEGLQTAPQYMVNFRQGLFYMLRDYLEQVPEDYQADSSQGAITFAFEKEGSLPGARGLELAPGEGVF